jgi:hypothetical protein
MLQSIVEVGIWIVIVGAMILIPVAIIVFADGESRKTNR